MPKRETSKTVAPGTTFVNPFEHSSLIEYLRAVRDWHGYIRFIGLPAFVQTSADVRIGNLFVEPRVSVSQLSPEAFEEGNEPDTTDLSTTLVENLKLILLGDPGSGKSTLVNWTCQQLAHPTGSLLREMLGEKIPFPLVVRELDIGPDITWETLLASFLRRPVAKALSGDRHLMMKLFENGQAFVLVDGIDELPTQTLREALRQAVWEAWRLYPKMQWLLTSRVVGYDEVPFDRLREHVIPKSRKADDSESMPLPLSRETQLAPVYYVAPFDDAQLQIFARQWWSQHEGNPHLVESTPQDFLRALSVNPGTRTLARVPNLLTLIALVFRARINLPDGRAVLYSKIAEAYCETIDVSRGLPVQFSRRDKERWLALIAWHLQRGRDTSRQSDDPGNQFRDILISRDEVWAVLRNFISNQAGSVGHTVADRFLDDITRRSGLLLPRGENRYAFMHLSFQEYFAAVYLRDILQNDRWLIENVVKDTDRSETSLQALRKYAQSEVWFETLVFLFEQLAESGQDTPLYRLRCLLGLDPFASDWQPLPQAESASPQTDDGNRGRFQVSALVTTLAVNPHTNFSSSVRSALLKLCWDWEVERQAQINDLWTIGDMRIASIALSRRSCAEESMTALAQVLVQRQTVGLRLPDGPALTELRHLTVATSLRHLHMDECPELQNLKDIGSFPFLETLHCMGCTRIPDLRPLTNLKHLRDLNLSRCIRLQDVTPLAGLQQLETAWLYQCKNISDITPLLDLRLTTLSILDTGAAGDLDTVSRLLSLETLNVGGSDLILGIERLTALHNLTKLGISNCGQLRNIDPIQALLQLREIWLSDCPLIEDVSVLSSLPRVEEITIFDLPLVTDYRWLLKINMLKKVALWGVNRGTLPKDLSKALSEKGVKLSP